MSTIPTMRELNAKHLLALFLGLAIVAQPASAGEPAGTKDANGFIVHEMDSPYQAGKCVVRILVPDRLEPGKKYPTIYVLPVEARDENRFGNGLLEVKKHDLHNKHQAVFVAPSFSTTPWYADHPTNPVLRQESHLLKVVIPFVEKTYPVRKETAGRLLLGFSKSGAGAFSLLLRHPDQFARALAFDAPLMREQMSKGQVVFGTQQNFEKYSVPRLLQETSPKLGGEKRLILLGKGFLQKQHVQAHALMDKLKIAHEFHEGTERKHTWDSGWVPEAVALLLTTPKQASTRKPNIILIVADDMGYADIGVHGCKDIPTPHIDSIAKNGFRFTNAYVSAPWCSPSRAGLLTGRYQQRFGHEFNPGRPGTGLPASEVTMASRLRALGYITGLIGKWHLGRGTQLVPTARGFQEFFGFLGAQHAYVPGAPSGGKKKKANSDSEIYRGTKLVDEKEYLTDAFGREAVDFIERHRKEPFFLYLSFNAVHVPMQASEKYLKRFSHIKDERRRTYAAMQSAMDDAIGAVLAKLRETRLEDDTIIIFLSDHGGASGFRTPNGAINWPLRGGKIDLYEGGVRVPFLIQWKGRLPAGRTFDQPILHLDILPTVLRAAGGKVQPEWKLDGVDLMPHLEGKVKTPPHEILYWRLGDHMAIRKGDWKLVRNDGKKTELFNLATDISETKDLSAKHPEIVRELDAHWLAWNATLVKPLWGSGPPGGGK